MAAHLWTRLLLAACFSSALLTQNALAQNAFLRGTVSDETHAPIPGVLVTAISSGQKAGLSTLSDAKGNFTLSVEPGKYVLNVSKTNFVSVSQTVEVVAGSSESREFALQLAPVKLAVTVTDNRAT